MKRGVLAAAAAALLLAAPGIARAQTYSCAVPANPPRPRPDLPSAEQPRRILPIGGYTLALTWAPQYCRSNSRQPSARFECRGGNRFGFTLHGLWPDGVGPSWPQYCRDTGLVSPAVIRAHLCTTPSAQLIQHEWAKHGTCMADRPADYFQQSSRLFAGLRYPDMNALSRRPLTADQFAAAIARANPGIEPTMMRITATRQGWLDEIWLCLDKKLAFARCPNHQGGLAGNAAIKIWRGRR
ncbi:MAG: ribonuclease T [Sphingomonas sp. 28-66-16]|nr:MAG: ribonuclease T [Sphingomonas sp. 28-66-16]